MEKVFCFTADNDNFHVKIFRCAFYYPNFAIWLFKLHIIELMNCMSIDEIYSFIFQILTKSSFINIGGYERGVTLMTESPFSPGMFYIFLILMT